MIQSIWFWAVILLSVPIFWLLAKGFRLSFLSIVSFGYLLWIAPLSVVCLLGFSIAIYAIAKTVPRERSGTLYVAFAVAIVAFLAAFKYAGPILQSFNSAELQSAQYLIPLGISYYVFKLLHLAIELNRGSIGDLTLPSLLSYAFLFTTFSSGPIERYDHYVANQETTPSRAMFAEGLWRIAIGLIKKFVVADILVEMLFGSISRSQLMHFLPGMSPLRTWVFLATAFLRAYIDFSAYSDIAIGASRLFGLRIMENFRFPIFAINLSEFWKRWHMTLTGWCTSYIYMPTMGRTRSPYVAAYASFIVMGIWHGASLNWVAWGVHHATGICIYGMWSRFKRQRYRDSLNGPAFRAGGWLLTMAFVSMGFAFIETASSLDALRVIAKLFFITLPVS
ncbi:Peptidoglycan O-acetyltransferase [Stieleria maiorica]|uniref:Peptidoglycan O-acetyltransferase n=1 Tax=Stieleria maiorica TaxID=2795974 RepID=A0A5B9MEV3_9BACT|nr:MBOAT family O-acyltransferase [Stieleria maiorica]QEF99628.1 Peptidoglycan O-acetyltransferase [Stieleria maiorica]